MSQFVDAPSTEVSRISEASDGREMYGARRCGILVAILEGNKGHDGGGGEVKR